MIEISVTDPDVLRLLAGQPGIQNVELLKADADGHKFKPGEVRTITGMESFPEYNGDEVTITAIREDGPYGKAYYVEGRINELMNWVYEYRLN
jgi:hypothetical protein